MGTAAQKLAAYYAAMIQGPFLGHKSAEKQAAAVEWVGTYCRVTLPDFMATRCDLRVTQTYEDLGT